MWKAVGKKWERKWESGGSRSLWGMLVGKLQQGSLTFVCNLASCFSSRLVCL